MKRWWEGNLLEDFWQVGMNKVSVLYPQNGKPSQKNSPGPKMTKNDPEAKNIPGKTEVESSVMSMLLFLFVFFV